MQSQPLRQLPFRHDLIEQRFQLRVLAADLNVQQAHLEHVVDARQYLGDIERLADEVLGAGPECAELVVRLRGDHEDGQVAGGFDLLQSFHHLKSVHTGHLEIEQDQVVAMLLVQRTHRAWIERGRDPLVSGVSQHALEQQDVGRLIVDNEDLGREVIGGFRHRRARPGARRPAPP